MNDAISMLKLTVIAALGVIAAYFNVLLIPLCVLVAVMLVDCVTGMASETIYDVAGTETLFNTNGKLAVSYRGMENPWGNIRKHVNGINLWGDGDDD